MLNILGESTRFCDGVSRREFLRIGALGMGGLSLPGLLQAEAEAGISSSNKSVIMIFLVGGASHIDMFDMKPDAPAEVRGVYRPIDTNVPGIKICEHLPKLARVMDRVVVLRSLQGGTKAHTADICLTGYPASKRNGENWPCFGSMVSRVQGTTDYGVPPFVSLTPKMKHGPWCLTGPTGFLGPTHKPFQPERDGSDAQLLENMTLRGVSLERLGDRRALLSSFDRFRREVDSSGAMAGLDAFGRQAFEVLTSNRLQAALDLEREDPRVRGRYGYGSMKNLGNGGPRCMDHFLMALRLVEAGVRCVSLAFGHWDWHSKQYEYLRDDFPPFDQGLSALIEDLHQRGLQKDVSVVVWGEMGRTPRINKNAGRDHWPKVSSALLLGGGMATGQVIGATSKYGEEATERPVHYQNVLATLYHKLGIHPGTTRVEGELQAGTQLLPLLDRQEPVRELI